MADTSIELNTGSGGATLAVDNDGTGDAHQYVKIEFGESGTQTNVSTTNPLPVDLRTDNLAGNIDVNIAADAAGLATAANQLPDGHNVTVDNAAGASAVNVQDGGNSLTVDAPVGTPVNVQLGDGTDTAAVTAAGDLQVTLAGESVTVDLGANNDVVTSPDNTISTNNSTTTPLGVSGNFTGTGEDVSDYAAVMVTVHANVDSAVDGMTFEFSTDNTNWDDSYTFSFVASEGTARRFQFPITAQYFRVNYTNGGTGQTTFRLQTIYLRNTSAYTSIHRLGDDISPDRSAEVVKAAIYAQAAGTGDYTSIDATTAGNLKVSLQEASDGLDIGAGNAGAETIRVSVATDDVNLSGILADTASMDTNLGTLAGAVSAGQMQVDIVADGAGLALAANQLAADHLVDLASEHARNDAFSEAVAIGGELDDTATTAATEGNVSPARITAQRALHANLRNNAGTEIGTVSNPIAVTDDGNAILVDGSAVTQPISAVSLPLPTGAATAANQLPDGHNVTVDNASGGSAVNIQDGGNSITVDNGGTFAVQSTLQAGSALAGDVGLSGARTSGGIPSVFIDSDVDNVAAAVKASAGQVFFIHAVNLDSAVNYLYVYNVAAGSVTVGVTTPRLRFPIPTQGDTNGAGFVFQIPNGIEFDTAISVAASATLDTNDDPGASVIHVNIGYA